MATLKEALDRFLGPSKGARLAPSGNEGFVSQRKSSSPYGIERVDRSSAVRWQQSEDRRLDALAAQQHADWAAVQAESKAALEGTETQAQWEARVGHKYTRSPYGIRPSTRFY